jgi:peptidoglycan/LPS O-acetylase OafA/YrhL
MVLAAHLGIWPGGWIGVPLFFVLSGLLITRILRRERAADSFWKPFYIKRATRILPPLAIAFLIGALSYSVPWRKIGFYYVFFAANISETLYQGAAGGLSVLWSLAVEEQFYLLWPFAIRFLNRKQLIRFLIALLVIEPILRAAFTPMFSTMWPIYFLTPFQLDGLAAGSLLAILLEDLGTTELLRFWSGKIFVSTVLLFSGLSFIPVFGVGTNSVEFNSVGYSLVALGAVSFICFVLLRPDALISKLLSIPVVTFLGTISYGIYLYHKIGMVLAVQIGAHMGDMHHKQLIFFSVLPMVAFSWLSFVLYERPIMRWGRRTAEGRDRSPGINRSSPL